MAGCTCIPQHRAASHARDARSAASERPALVPTPAGTRSHAVPRATTTDRGTDWRTNGRRRISNQDKRFAPRAGRHKCTDCSSCLGLSCSFHAPPGARPHLCRYAVLGLRSLRCKTVCLWAHRYPELAKYRVPQRDRPHAASHHSTPTVPSAPKRGRSSAAATTSLASTATRSSPGTGLVLRGFALRVADQHSRIPGTASELQSPHGSVGRTICTLLASTSHMLRRYAALKDT